MDVVRVNNARRSIETKAFREWFGNSKVVDVNGNPLVVYHGTCQDFSRFSKNVFANFNTPQEKIGFFFTNDAEYAGQYADRDGGHILPVFLSIQNPRREPLSTIDEIENGTRQQAGRYVAQLKHSGHDGIIFGDGREIAVFQSTQIKSAIGNQGTFNPKNPDITEYVSRVRRRKRTNPNENLDDIEQALRAASSRRSRHGSVMPS